MACPTPQQTLLFGDNDEAVTISLVSAPVVGFDLVRHPRGRAVADILLWGLNLRPADLPSVAAAAHKPVATRRRAWAEVRDVQRAQGPGVLHGAVPASTAGGDRGSVDDMIEALRTSLIMDLDDLEQLIRGDIMRPENGTPGPINADAGAVENTVGTAAGVLLDAVVAEWVDGLSVASRDDLARPYQSVRTRLGVRTADVGPGTGEVDAVLDTLRTLGSDGRTRLRAANALLGAKGSVWSEAVHEASWAALTTGRIRAAATAQLLAAQAFHDGGLDATDGAEGVWNLISGHVHALVVCDVLPSSTQQTLGACWHSAMPSN